MCKVLYPQSDADREMEELVVRRYYFSFFNTFTLIKNLALRHQHAAEPLVSVGAHQTSTCTGEWGQHCAWSYPCYHAGPF